MVKVRGRNSNGKTVKQTVKNGRKNLGWRRRAAGMSHGARRQQFAAASRFWSIPNLMPRSTVTRVWLTEWAHLGQLCGTLTSDNLFFFFFFVVSWVLFDKSSDRVQSVTQGTWYSGRSSMLSSDSWLIDIGERSHPTRCIAVRCSSATSKTGNRFGWSFFFAVWRRCARSQLHMNSVVLVESQGSCALVRIVRIQKFDRRDNMIFTESQSTSTDWLTRTHHWGSPRSKLAYKKPTSTRKLRKFPVTSGQGSKHRDWTASDCVTMMSEMTIGVIVVSASCHHLTRADSGWSRISWFSRVTLPWLRGGTSVAPWRHKCLHVPVFRRLFDRLPVRISTSELHHRILRKKLYHIRDYDFGVQFSFNHSTDKDTAWCFSWHLKNSARRKSLECPLTPLEKAWNYH